MTDRLDEIRKRLERAPSVVTELGESLSCHVDARDFVINAPQDIAYLLAEVERLRADNSSLRMDLCDHNWTAREPDDMFTAGIWWECLKCGAAMTKGPSAHDRTTS